MGIQASRRDVIKYSGGATVLGLSNGWSNIFADIGTNPSIESDWTYGRGNPKQTGHSEDATPPKIGELGKDRELGFEGSLLSAPIVKDNIIYVLSGDRSENYVQAYDFDGGEQTWTVSYESEFDSDAGAHLSIVGATLCVSSFLKVKALDKDDGSELWEREFSSAVAVGERVYAYENGIGPVALNLGTGKTEWKSETYPDSGFPADVPLPPSVSDERLYYCTQSYLEAINRSDGSLAWNYEYTGNLMNDIPSLSQGTLVTVGYSDVVSFDVSSGTKQWTKHIDGNSDANISTAVHDGRVFVGGGDYISSLELSSGDEIWRNEDFRYVSPPSVANGVVYFSHSKGVAGVDPKTGDEVVSFDVDGYSGEFGADNSYGTPLTGESIISTETDYASLFVGKNQSPSPTFSYKPTNPTVGESIELNASDSEDPDGEITSYEWETEPPGEIESSGETLSVTFSNDGKVEVTLTVTDDDGDSAHTSRTIVVESTATPTETESPTPTATQTERPVPTEAPVQAETSTKSPTPTDFQTPTPTETSFPTETSTQTETLTSTSTSTGASPTPKTMTSENSAGGAIANSTDTQTTQTRPTPTPSPTTSEPPGPPCASKESYGLILCLLGVFLATESLLILGVGLSIVLLVLVWERKVEGEHGNR